MLELKTTDFPHFVILVCGADDTDWQVMRSFDPDQEQQAIDTAKDYLESLQEGSQVGVAEIRRYGIIDGGGGR